MAKRTRAAPSVISNQVFIGCPWKTVRPKYERVIDRLNKRFPLSFVIVGRRDGQDARDLLEIIKERILTSSYAIFDASNGNPNVSLEFGFAEAVDIDRAIYVSSRKGPSRSGADSAIISDLAGKKRNHYTNENKLTALLVEHCKDHPYTRRFEKALKTHLANRTRGRKKSLRALATKSIHRLDGKASVRRADLVQELLGQGYAEVDVEFVLKMLHTAKLLRVFRGRYSQVEIGAIK